jgi:hypothetical protein
VLGCTEYPVRIGQHKDGDESLDDVCVEHGWPIFLKPPKAQLDDWTDWLTSAERRNCILPLNWYAAKVLAARPGWHIIEAGRYVSPIGICDTARKVLPSFLRYVATQQFKLPTGYRRTGAAGFTHTILVWLSQWYAAQGGNYKVVLNALKVTNFDGDHRRGRRAVDAFTDLLCRFFEEGELSMERAGFIPARKPIKALICFPGEQGSIGLIFIPKMTVNKLLVSHNAPMLDAPGLSRILAESGATAEQEYGGLTGWMLNEAVWNKRLTAWRTWHRYKLRVIE